MLGLDSFASQLLTAILTNFPINKPEKIASRPAFRIGLRWAYLNVLTLEELVFLNHLILVGISVMKQFLK